MNYSVSTSPAASGEETLGYNSRFLPTTPQANAPINQANGRNIAAPGTTRGLGYSDHLLIEAQGSQAYTVDSSDDSDVVPISPPGTPSQDTQPPNHSPVPTQGVPTFQGPRDSTQGMDPPPGQELFRQRGSRWVFTWNNPPQDWDRHLRTLCQDTTLAVSFCIAGLEHANGEGTPHIQGYLRLRDRVYMRTLRKRIECWWNVAKGSEEDNVAYCTKEGGYVFKYGTPLTQKLRKRMAKDEHVRTLQRDVVNKPWVEFEKLHPYEATYQQQVWLKYKYEHAPVENTWGGDLPMKNYWVWGPPGTGKSRWAWSQAGPIYTKLQNKWWDGFHLDSYKTVLIEDWGRDKAMLAPNLKQWADRYRFIAEIKNGTIWVEPGRFNLIVTSNFSIDQCFNYEDAEALKRRFTEMQIEDDRDIRLTMSIPQMTLQDQ